MPPELNATSKPVREIYVSSSATQNWGDNLLGADVLAPGATFMVTPPQGGLYDVRVVMMNNANADQRQPDVCRIQRITVTNGGLQVQ